MFKQSDFWKIFKLLNGESITNCDTSLRQLAKSEYAKTFEFFKLVIDQIAHNSSDYQRLKNFLTKWYASHKTLTSVQKHVSDPFSLPQNHLDELIRSFGYPHARELTLYSEDVNYNKVSFFLDLVNLYKVKGTPESIVRALNYYYIRELDLIEFWLKKDQKLNDIVFQGDVVVSTVSGINTSTLPSFIDYDGLVKYDPHWNISKEKILQLISQHKLGIPSKTPYFSLRPRFDFAEAEVVISIIEKTIRDQYNEWQSTGSIQDKNIDVELVGYTLSLLEVYLAAVLCFNKLYNIGQSPQQQFVCYDGTTTVVSEILQEYHDLVSKPVYSRSEQRARYNQYFNTFVCQPAGDILSDKFSCETIISQVNPEFYNDLQSFFVTTRKTFDALSSLLRNVGKWSRTFIGSGVQNIAYLILGKKALLDDVGNVVDFFKPLRARLVSVEVFTVAENRLMDTVLCEDKYIDTVVQGIWDYVTSDSHPCCSYPILECPDHSNEQYYSRENYNCGSYFDIGSCWDDGVPYEIRITDQYDDVLCCRQNTDPNKLSTNGYTELANEVVAATQSGGFVDFDEEGTFDCVYGNDVAFIELV